MTLNQVIRRIKSLCVAHKQVNTFGVGLVQDFFNDQTTKYPAVMLQDRGGNISLQGKSMTLNYRMFFSDLVSVSDNTKDNEQDVQSDMVSVAMDILAQMNSGYFSDWVIGSENSVVLFVENENDMHAGCYIDISIRTMYKQNVCEIPSDILLLDSNTTITAGEVSSQKVEDLVYIATGNEDKTITIEALKNKKILFISRMGSIIYKTSNLPDTFEFTFDSVSIGLGASTTANERFLILYRNN